jgi:hypothetical protein
MIVVVVIDTVDKQARYRVDHTERVHGLASGRRPPL